MPTSRRADIQGLRAIAVVAVVIDHVVGSPVGGFLGVDVFFVISGFLITGQMFREFEKSGRISLGDFYRRRLRRLAPTATLVALATLVAAHITFNTARFNHTLVDSLWSWLGAANWHFLIVGSDYFQNQGPTSPFRHYWSLAVEEQFYVVWPAVFLLLLGAFRRSSLERRRILVAGCLGALAVVSLVYSIVYTASDSSGAYFSTFSRAWELAVGALLAMLAPGLKSFSRVARLVLSWGGLAGLAASFALIHEDLGIPGPWAVVPVVSTAMIIAGGTHAPPNSRMPAILTNRAVTYIGGISFSLYLWHFPVLVIADSLLDPGTWFRVAAIVVVSLALAVGSFHLLEKPVTASPLFMRGQREGQHSAWLAWRKEWRQTYRVGGFAALATLTALVVAVASTSQNPVSLPPAPVAIESAPTTHAPTVDDSDATSDFQGPEVKSIRAEIGRSLSATSWPDLTPSLDSILEKSAPSDPVLGCGVAGADREKCTFGPSSASKTAVLVGDSTAVHYLDAFRQLTEASSSEWKIVNFSMFACPFIDLPVDNDTGNANACARHNHETIDAVLSMRPDLVITTNSYQALKNDESKKEISASEWKAGVLAHQKRLSASGADLVLLSPPPFSADITNCYTRQSVPSRCVSHTTAGWSARAAAERQVASDLDAHFVDARLVTCIDNRCPAFIGNVPVKEDLIHLSAAFTASLARPFKEIFSELGYF